MISIWFFIGAILLLYGAIILIAAFAMTPPSNVVLTKLHAGIWWGGLLFVVGLYYTVRFRPGSGRE